MIARELLPLFCFGFDGTEVPEHIRRLLGEGLGGIILLKRNLQDLEQICALTASLHRHAAGPLLVGVDQEGGRVVRLPTPFLAPPPAAALGRIGDPELTRDVARAVGLELRAAGFNWNLVPVLDVHTNPANPIIGDRAFSHDPDCVTRMGLATLRGFQDAGILTTGKHFPGHGQTAADSHLTLPESPQSAERWREVEFFPFREAIRAGIPSILAAHLVCPALDPNAPSSLSHVVITDILRGELGFDGVVISDDMEMGAIVTRFDIGEAAVRFLEAGGDLILVCKDADLQQKSLAAVEDAVCRERLSEARLESSRDRVRGIRARYALNEHERVRNAANSIVGNPTHARLLESIRTRTLGPS
ncbi:MAG: beta-N-acetylhexosaminidase [Zetaproteobacteria bacterium]|nr:MAG: beta-N-acetylhexosaminidase [Zetaproteobacteria bacterium]